MDSDAGAVLVKLARAAIVAGCRGDNAALDIPDADWLAAPGASFVTLTVQGRLRGCIGSLTAHRALGADVVANARNAAFRDPRFAPVTAPDELEIEVSVLSQPVDYAFGSKQEALAGLRPGVDGVILTAGHHRATFLPQVWEELPDPADFIAHLLRKAGLPASYWGPDVRLQRYTVTAFHE
ncbi:MAG: AmmeMemoRadiSam system protein A [Propionibacteriaceae bacterium]|jgi:AmmeMemoRadiSam system protein A|nr:AmmeMemoRadiSam system protein A [Propionibacteriaceae bacterium]